MFVIRNRKSSPIIPRQRRQNLSKTFLWHLPPRQSSEAAPANSVPVPENETRVRVREESGRVEPWSHRPRLLEMSQGWFVRAMSDEMIGSWGRLTEGYETGGGSWACHIVTLYIVWPHWHICSEDLWLIKTTFNTRLVKQVQWSKETLPVEEVLKIWQSNQKRVTGAEDYWVEK